MKNLKDILKGYHLFRKKYVEDECELMRVLSVHGQKPQVMVISCCDSRVDPAVILQCDPGDLFVLRNIANIVPKYDDINSSHHGTSAALEYGINHLKVKHLIIMGHSNCGGIHAWKDNSKLCPNSFLFNWLSIIHLPDPHTMDVDECAKVALKTSYENCLTFPWIKAKVTNKQLEIHLWFFDIKTGNIKIYSHSQQKYVNLTKD